MDDWARRKGQTYATILVDLERHKPIDVLSDREASSLADWLRSHPEVQFIRAGIGLQLLRRWSSPGSASGGANSLPRWHFLLKKNLSEALERFVDRHHRLVRRAAKNVVEVHLIDHWLAENSEAMHPLQR